MNNLPLRCTLNAQAGRESEQSTRIVKTNAPKKVAVIGAGPAGLEAAYILGKRGHHVHIYEASGQICGGQLQTATLPPSKDVLKNIPEFYNEQLSRLPNVTLHLNCPISADNLDSVSADVVLLATGANALIPNIPGIDNENVYTAEQVLKGEVTLSGKVAVAGGGQIGGETAHFLLEKGCQVSIIEMLPAILVKEELITMLTLLNILSTAGAEILTDTKISKFNVDSVEAVNTLSGESVTVPCDAVVLAFGTTSEKSLYDVLKTKFNEVIVIGDANEVGNIQTAIHDGFFTALDI